MDVGAWLRGLGLERYAQAFRDAEIAPDVLPELTEADLRELGLPLGPRRTVLKAIRDLRPPARVTQPGAAVDGAMEPTTNVSPEAERRQLTVMFIDLVGSTELSRHLDPEDMHELVHTYHNLVSAEVVRFEGYVAKFLGDGVLAYFGWPRAYEDAAERAVRAGLGIAAAVSRIAGPAGEQLAARIGIATGRVVVGDLVGSEEARERAVVGEAPNLAARLQELAEPGSVVIAEAARRLLGDLFAIRELGPTHLKGFAEPVRAWAVIGEAPLEGRFEALHATSLTPLVGREHEVALLLDRWERAKAGEGQTVLLCGEPGIGKSRLVLALREQLRAERYTRLHYQCSAYHVHSTLWPIVEQLRLAAGLARDDAAAVKLDKLEAMLDASVDEAAGVISFFAELLAIPTSARYPQLDLSPQQIKAKTIQALLQQLDGFARHRPLLIILEDAHWADPTTLELFDLVVERLQRLPALLVITCRPEFRPAWTGHAHVSLLSLASLSHRLAAAMIGKLTAGKVLPPEIARHIVAKTDGVPLFVEELTKSVLESGLLRDAGSRYALAGPLPALMIPATLEDSLLARLDRLAPAKEVAQIAACLGREFSYELLAAVAARPSDAVWQALADLVTAGLVFGHGTRPHARFTFKHALVQEAAYRSLLRSRRRKLHARIARVIEERFPEVVSAQPELIAHHLTQAGLVEPAIVYWQKAGDLANARSALAEAVAHLTQAMDLLDRLPDTVDRQRRELALQVALGATFAGTKGYASHQARRAWQRARELCAILEEPTQLLRVLRGQCSVHSVSAEFGRSREIGNELVRLGVAQDSVATQAAGHRAVGLSLFNEGDFASSCRHLEQVLAIHDPLQHSTFGFYFDERIVSLCYLSLILVICGYADQARRRIWNALTKAQELSHPGTIAYVRSYCFMVQELCGDVQAALAEAEAYLALSQEQGFSMCIGEAMAFTGWALAETGQPAEGIRKIRQGMAGMLARRMRLAIPYERAHLADAYGRGNRPKAERLHQLNRAITQSERTRELWFNAELYHRRGAVMASGADPDLIAAEADFRHAIAVARAQVARLWELRAVTSLGRLLRDRRARTEAYALLAPVCDWFTEGFDLPDLQRAKALLDTLR